MEMEMEMKKHECMPKQDNPLLMAQENDIESLEQKTILEGGGITDKQPKYSSWHPARQQQPMT